MNVGDGYQVDPQELEDAAAQLNSLINGLSPGVFDTSVYTATTLGHEDLALATVKHVALWQRALLACVEDAAEVADRLHSTAALYAQQDENLANNFRSILHPETAPNA